LFRGKCQFIKDTKILNRQLYCQVSSVHLL
jgi:hypothetical protein